jgi:hypothetical protein
MPSEEELIPFPYYNGHSVGHFEGDTLVVETAGFNEKTFIDATGAPQSCAPSSASARSARPSSRT